MPLQLPAPVGCSQQHLLLRLGRGGLGWLTRAAEGASLWIQIGGASP